MHQFQSQQKAQYAHISAIYFFEVNLFFERKNSADFLEANIHCFVKNFRQLPKTFDNYTTLLICYLMKTFLGMKVPAFKCVGFSRADFISL